MTTSKLMKIGELAEKAGTTPRTIRLYEELGLIEPAGHSKGGFRLFSSRELNRLRFIHDLKLLGVPLAGIADLFRARTQGKTTREAADRMIAELRGKLDMIDARIHSYRRMKEEIRRIIEIYSECPECGSLPSREVCFRCEILTSRDLVPKLLQAIL